ncbi:CadD family cadmium resistance transporter [Mesobacillus maritimus]|uniref:CadD family cadmium resistance transporter n=1 Tax=Mesobacillus maritimus TaxID=1643336 RepID=UPI00203E667F|nr:CadD family cadmium resistance transporter [Mesobacillus maritimus]MCM3670274.1 CadD family cadmium resistance transporter [Mesobacillus maritimus]
MTPTILSAIGAYIATSIDYIVILVVLFSQFKKKKDGIRNIVVGQYLGFTILIAISLLTAFGLAYVPQNWIGLLGLIPIFIGLKVLFEREEDKEADEDEDEEIIEATNRFGRLFLSVAFISIAAGGDNLGVYIPYFTTINALELVVTLAIFYFLAAVLLYFCYRISAFKSVSETVEKYEKIIVPIVFIALGIMIMFENETVSWFLNLM